MACAAVTPNRFYRRRLRLPHLKILDECSPDTFNILMIVYLTLCADEFGFHKNWHLGQVANQRTPQTLTFMSASADPEVNACQ